MTVTRNQGPTIFWEKKNLRLGLYLLGEHSHTHTHIPPPPSGVKKSTGSTNVECDRRIIIIIITT
jgi:hypothetical protein